MPVKRIVIGIKNSTTFEVSSGEFNVTIAKVIECPMVNAVIKPSRFFQCFIFMPAMRSIKKSM